MIRWIKRKWYEFKYRNIDEDICCCGGYVSKGGYGCFAHCRSQKEYVITELLK